MLSVLRSSTTRDLAIVQAPSFVSAFIVAEIFYKFHSFMLETGAFLATWLVFEAVATALSARFRRDPVSSSEIAS